MAAAKSTSKSKPKIAAKSKAAPKAAAKSKSAPKAAAKSKAAPKAAAESKSAPKAAKASAKPAGGDWREETLSRMRTLIQEADPEMTEERKWVKATKPQGVPVWSHGGIVCTGETYKAVVKLTFMYGASLADPKRLFNSGLDGGTRRAIDIPEGHEVDAAAFKALIKAAVGYNLERGKKR